MLTFALSDSVQSERDKMTKKQLYKFVFFMISIATLLSTFYAIKNGLILHATGVFSIGVVAAASQIMLLETEKKDDR